MTDPEEASAVIDFLDGTAAVASIFGIRPPSVTEWRDRGIPRGRLMHLAPMLESMAGSRWTRRSLFPEDCLTIWPELRKPQATKTKAEA